MRTKVGSPPQCLSNPDSLYTAPGTELHACLSELLGCLLQLCEVDCTFITVLQMRKLRVGGSETWPKSPLRVLQGLDVNPSRSDPKVCAAHSSLLPREPWLSMVVDDLGSQNTLRI